MCVCALSCVSLSALSGMSLSVYVRTPLPRYSLSACVCVCVCVRACVRARARACVCANVCQCVIVCVLTQR